MDEKAEKLDDSEQRDRLWQHRLHIEDLLYTRLNFFLIFESVLLAVVGALYSKTGQSTLALRVIIVLGFCITLVWLYVQHNVKQLLFILHERACANFPEFKESMKRMLSKRKVVRKLGTDNPATLLLTYGVPVLVALVWVFLLFFL
jgi:hypothetical protein